MAEITSPQNASNTNFMNDHTEPLPEEPNSPWRNKRQMAEHFGCDIRTITNFMRRRILPFVKIGRFVRFDVHECDKAIDRYKRKAGT